MSKISCQSTGGKKVNPHTCLCKFESNGRDYHKLLKFKDIKDG